MKRDAGGSVIVVDDCSVVGRGVSGAEVIAERFRGAGEAVDLI